MTFNAAEINKVLMKLKDQDTNQENLKEVARPLLYYELLCTNKVQLVTIHKVETEVSGQ